MLLLLAACTAAPDGAPDDTAAEDTCAPSPLGCGDGSRESVGWTYVLGQAEDLFDPKDLGFDASGILWVANRADDRTFLVFDPGTPDQTWERRRDGYAQHFMEETMAFSFDGGTQFGSCGESLNTYNDRYPGDLFMGPVLWTTDLDVFAEQDPYGLGSHLDMLHESPLCMGIAWEHDNVYWVFDGYNENIVRYDFQADHDVGQDYHGDGIIQRLSEPEVAYVAQVPAHMAIAPDTGILYAADPGNGRVVWIDTASGSAGERIRHSGEPVAQYNWLDGVDWGVVIEGLDQPAGLALGSDRMWIGEHGTGIIHEVLLDGTPVRTLDTGVGPAALFGIELGPDGKLWVVDGAGLAVWRIEPEG